MYSYKKKQLPKNTVELTISIPWHDIEKKYEVSFEFLRSELKAEGFRKGKVPKKIAEQKIRKEDVYDNLLRSYISRIYGEFLKKEDIKPIVSPKVELKTAKEQKDWELIMTTAEEPKIVLGSYKDKIKQAVDKLKKDDIWVPGKDTQPTKEEKEKNESAVFQAKLA